MTKKKAKKEIITLKSYKKIKRMLDSAISLSKEGVTINPKTINLVKKSTNKKIVNPQQFGWFITIKLQPNGIIFSPLKVAENNNLKLPKNLNHINLWNRKNEWTYKEYVALKNLIEELYEDLSINQALNIKVKVKAG